MASNNRTNSSDRGKTVTDIPTVPTIGTAAVSGQTVTVEFTPSAKGGTATGYTVVSTPGSITATGASSPITVSGLSPTTAYTFVVRANNSTGSSEYSSASNSITTPALPSITGGTLTSDTTYYYRTFLSSGTVTVTNGPLVVDALLIGGGTSGQTYNGGRAGSVNLFTSVSTPTGDSSIVVGNGGYGNNRTNGTASTFLGNTASAGGGANGGNGLSSGQNGPSAYSSWASATSTGRDGGYYAGGGGGTDDNSNRGNGGLGGGGGGGQTGQNGATNTGSGAGGSLYGNNNSGGSGLVIIRYLKSSVAA